MDVCALFRRFPQIAKTIPWLPLAQVPTPVEQFSFDAGTSKFWIKRDDLAGSTYGGNKVRKLEFLLAAAQARGARRLITVGAMGSHHVLATTIYGRSLGFDVTAILFPQPLTAHVREILLLDHAYGAELRYTRRMETVPPALFANVLRYRKQQAVVIPAGGSDAVGTLGHVNAGLELAEQIANQELPEPATIVMAAGTLGTAAGLALGLAIAGVPAKIKAVRITSRIVTNERVLMRLINGAETLLKRAGAPIDVAAAARARVELVHDYMGAGYGQATEQGDRATALFAERGIKLDPTYTAKAAAAFMAYASQAEGPMIYWHTLSANTPVAPSTTSTESDLPEAFRAYLSSANMEPL